MVTEDYISYEIAKLLTEKGFIIPYDSFRGVYINGIFKRLNPGTGYGYNSDDEVIAVCSLQLAMKWLREVHKIHVAIYPYGDYSCDNYQFDVYKDGNFVVSKDDGYITYEDACEAAIKYCIENLI